MKVRINKNTILHIMRNYKFSFYYESEVFDVEQCNHVYVGLGFWELTFAQGPNHEN